MMIEMLINEIEQALGKRLYMVALNTALTLPDICGKAKYPTLKTAERYKKWYDEYVGIKERSNKLEGYVPYLSSDVVYQLRCSLLHQGNPNIEKKKTGVDCFELVIEAPQEYFAIYADSSMVCLSVDNSVSFNYRVSIHRLCLILCDAARKFYSQNKEKFNFFNYSIIDLEKEMSKMQPYLDCIREYEIEEARKSQSSK